ncbi:MAG: hypothetical protein AMJ68_10975 [Acidithiobacillales bacterium SG8_45]|nr:MAG: hypothetical protein AMJ68_10975 [Acidithiobacillales bacterium SG8_45]
MHTQVGIVLGSRSEWHTMKHAGELLAQLGIAYEAHIVTANKNTNRLQDYASTAIDRGLEIIIAGSCTARPGGKKELNSDSETRSPVGMLTTGPEGAVNAALLAASMLGNKYPKIREKLAQYRGQQRSENASLETERQVA